MDCGHLWKVLHVCPFMEGSVCSSCQGLIRKRGTTLGILFEFYFSVYFAHLFSALESTHTGYFKRGSLIQGIDLIGIDLKGPKIALMYDFRKQVPPWGSKGRAWMLGGRALWSWGSGSRGSVMTLLLLGSLRGTMRLFLAVQTEVENWNLLSPPGQRAAAEMMLTGERRFILSPPVCLSFFLVSSRNPGEPNRRQLARDSGKWGIQHDNPTPWDSLKGVVNES